MRLTVLSVPDCPNLALLDARLHLALSGLSQVMVAHRVIDDPAEAARWGMHGSPTLLVGGIDPFAERGQTASVSCRLYRDAEGQVAGAPSVEQLRRVLQEADRD